jgi:hypothetical protein
MRQMLLLNTNRIDAFSLADLHGVPLASTDGSFGPITTHAAYLQSTASGSVSMSALISDGGDTEIDYAAPVHDATGATIAILVGRTTPQRLWITTLATKIDGSANVLLDRDGHALGLGSSAPAWTPASGAQTAAVDGVPSACAQAPIGRGTHLDQGWTIASCLPRSIAVQSAPFPSLRFAVDAIAIVLVVFSAALLLLAWLLGERERAVRKPLPPTGLKAIEARLLAQRDGPNSR